MSTTGASDLREEGAAALRGVRARGQRGTDDCGCGSGGCCADGDDASISFGESRYDAEQRGELPDKAALASLGCGNPTAVSGAC